MSMEGGHQTDTVPPTFPAILATPLDTDVDLTLAETAAKATPVLIATGAALAAVPVSTPAGTVVVHTGGKPIKVEAAALPTFSRIFIIIFFWWESYSLHL